MHHIKAKFIDTGGMHGEFSVSDFVVFPDGGSLKHVSRFWDAVIAQALVLDRAHASVLKDWSSTAETESDPEFGIEAAWRVEVLGVSDQYLVRANIFLLLFSFFEFAMLEVYKLRFGMPPTKKRPMLMRDIVVPLQAEGIVGLLPGVFTREVTEHLDNVRNSFAHGRWLDLKSNTSKIDLYEAVAAICRVLWEVGDRLRGKGYTP